MRRFLLGGAVSALAATLAIGALHHPAAKPALLWLAGGSCPIGADLPVAEREAARREALASFLGPDAAGARTVAGLTLGATTRETLPAWATDCAEGCVAPDGRQVTLSFDPDGRLVAVDLTADEPDPRAAWTRLSARAAEVAAVAGPPTATRGHPDQLASGPLSQAAASFRFEDYRVELTATNLGQRFRVRETHQVP